MNDEKMITLETGDGEKVNFYVVEETRISGMNYLLVTDAPVCWHTSSSSCVNRRRHPFLEL